MLSQADYEAIARLFRAALEEPRARPGVVASIQSFGRGLEEFPGEDEVVAEDRGVEAE